jgi:hypothetical protein
MYIIYSFFKIIKYIFALILIIKVVENKEFKDLLKLSNGEYFIILDNCFYIYDKDFNIKKEKKLFKNFVIKQSKISEFKNNDDINIICLLSCYDSFYNGHNNCIYIYIYNYNLNKITFEDVEYHDFSGNELDEDNICIKNDIITKYESANLDLNLTEIADSFKYEENIESFDFVFFCYNLDFKNKIINNELLGDCESNCHIFSDLSTIRCFFYEKNFLINVKYIIDSSEIFLNKKLNIHEKSEKIFYYETNINIENLKFSIAENNNFFVCYYLNEKLNSKEYISCDIFYSFDNYTEIPCINFDKCTNYQTFYFDETDEFVLVCKFSEKFVLSIIKNQDYPEYNFNNCYTKTFYIKCNDFFGDFGIKFGNFEDFIEEFFGIDYNGNYSVIFNSIIQDYDIIIDDNFTENKECKIVNEEDFKREFNETTENKENYLDNSINIKNNEEEKIETIIAKKSKEEILNNITEFIQDKEIGKNYKIEGEGFSLIIKPTNSTAFENSTHVDFEKCEQLLREKYNISNSSIITFFQMELTNNDENALYNQIKYFTYDDKKQELNLSLCEDIKTKIHFMLKNGSNLDKSTINKFKNLGVDIFNIKDEFFTDLCFSYSDSNNDMILEDRIKYIYQNYSLCEEEGCSYNNIDIEKMSITCDCKIQGNFSSITTSLVDDQANEVSFLDSNIGVVKCYKLVFSFKNKSSNIGFILFTILIIAYIIFFCILIKRGTKPISDFVFNEMKKFGYLNKDNNTNSENEKEKNNKDRHNAENQMVANPKKKGRGKKKKKIKKFAGNKGKSLEIKMNMETNGEEKNERGNKESIITNLKFFNNFVINNNNDSSKESDSKMDNFGIIKVNINESIKEYMPEDSNQTLHNYTFEEAIKYDRRNIFRIFYIYLLSKQIIFHTFLLRSPLELFSLRFTLFVFMLSCDLALNSLFYLNDNISKKYHYAKNLFLFAFSNNITIIIYSTLISYVLITLMTKLSNTSNAIRKVFRKEEEKIKHKKGYKIKEETKKEIYSEILNIFKKYKIKLIILFSIEIILILFFWYFVTAFCHVYSSTQTSWLLDSFLSILSRFIMELIFAFLYGKLYQISVASNFETLYKIVLFLYDFTI